MAEDFPDLRVCALIPCLDCAPTIASIVRHARTLVEIVWVIDDGSTDGTADVAGEAGAVVLRHAQNRGKGAALLTGLAAARAKGFSHAVTLDGDGQHDPAEIPALIAAARSQPTALVVGARRFPRENVPRASRFGRWWSNLWVSLETGRRLSDTQSGMRVYPVKPTLALNLRPSRFEWEVEVIVRTCWAGAPVIEVPVAVRYPPGRRSHYRPYYDSMRISRLHCRLFLSGPAAPAPLATGVGVGVFIGCSPLYGLHSLIGLFLARLLRLNALAVLFGTQVSFPVIAPLLVTACVQVGRRLRTGQWLARPGTLDVAAAGDFLADWALGGAVVGAMLAVLLGSLTYAAALAWRRRPAPAEPRWTGRSLGTRLGYEIFHQALRLLGRRAGYLMLWFVVPYYLLFARAARRQSDAYLARVLGPRGWWRRQIDVGRHFMAFGRSIVDSVLVMQGRSAEFAFQHEHVEYIHQSYAEGRGLILLSAHVGTRALGGEFLSGLKLNLVVYDNEAEGIRRFYARLRAGDAPRVIVANDGLLASIEILGALSRGEAVAMLADRTRVGRSLVLPFLGEPANFPAGPFLVAVLSGAPVVITFGMKDGARRQHFYAVPPRTLGAVPRERREQAIEEAARWYVAELESFVRRCPYQWYNFYDFWAPGP